MSPGYFKRSWDDGSWATTTSRTYSDSDLERVDPFDYHKSYKEMVEEIEKRQKEDRDRMREQRMMDRVNRAAMYGSAVFKDSWVDDEPQTKPKDHGDLSGVENDDATQYKVDGIGLGSAMVTKITMDGREFVAKDGSDEVAFSEKKKPVSPAMYPYYKKLYEYQCKVDPSFRQEGVDVVTQLRQAKLI